MATDDDDLGEAIRLEAQRAFSERLSRRVRAMMGRYQTYEGQEDHVLERVLEKIREETPTTTETPQ